MRIRILGFVEFQRCIQHIERDEDCADLIINMTLTVKSSDVRVALQRLSVQQSNVYRGSM